MKALIIIDVQNDFMPTGSLPVKEGDQIIPFINAEMQKGYDLVVATQDWHPATHKSFASQYRTNIVARSLCARDFWCSTT